MPDTGRRGQLACNTCYQQKRKCGKEFPACSLCQKNGRPCSYNREAIQQQRQVPLGVSPSTSDNQNDHGTPGSGQIVQHFPASFFLDYNAFKMLGAATIRRSNPELASELKDLAGDLALIRHVADMYFNSTHGHFPIVSKLRFYQILAASSTTVPNDFATLVGAMMLHTYPAAIGRENSDLCFIMHTGLSKTLIAGTYTVHQLQAYLLIALYELANAIYPAAYLTIGHCVRLGHLLGISPNEKAPQLLNPPGRAPVWHVKFLNEANDRVGTATELEERRRTWWGIMVLDRCVNIGGPQRSLGSDDPGPNDFLPMDDTFWDRGELTSLQPLVTTINVVDPVSPFARTCQASHLLSRVLQHIRGAGQGSDAGYGEAVQLHRTLLALGTVIDSESRALVEKTSNPIARTPLLTATGLCFSALLTLYDHYSCAETSSAEQRANSQWNEMHRIALSGLKEVSGRVTEFALAIMNIADLGGILHVSPLVSDCLYQAGANYVWYLCETGNEEYQNMQNVIRNALELLGTRWRAPREYIHILVLSQNRVLNLYGSSARLATQTVEMAIG